MIYHGCIDSEVMSNAPEIIVTTGIVTDIVKSHSEAGGSVDLIPHCCICHSEEDLALAIYIPPETEIKYPLFQNKCGMTYFYVFCVCKDHERLLGSSHPFIGVPRILTQIPSKLKTLLLNYLKKERKNVLQRPISTTNKQMS